MELFRKINAEIQQDLGIFIKSYINQEPHPTVWKNFYSFVLISYKHTLNQRPSVSQLNEILKSNAIEDSGNYSVLYAHCLYCLALKDNLEIYKHGFNP